jgi:hypothetical protein
VFSASVERDSVGRGARGVFVALVGSSESEREVGDEQCPVHASAAPRVPHVNAPVPREREAAWLGSGPRLAVSGGAHRVTAKSRARVEVGRMGISPGFNGARKSQAPSGLGRR